MGNPDFAIVDEAYPYISKRLLTDDTPRLRAALKVSPRDTPLTPSPLIPLTLYTHLYTLQYMVYGKSNVFDADRLIDLLSALEVSPSNPNPFTPYSPYAPKPLSPSRIILMRLHRLVGTWTGGILIPLTHPTCHVIPNLYGTWTARDPFPPLCHQEVPLLL